jgi:hypothetical protein
MIDPAEKERLSRELLAAVRIHEGEAQGADMWEIGREIGLERDRVEDLAMELAAEDLVEIKSLSGKLALTEAGKRAVAGGASEGSDGQAPPLGYVADKLEAIKPDLGLAGEALNDFEIDLYVLKAQNSRSQPLPLVLRGVLQALTAALTDASGDQTEALGLIQNLLRDLDKGRL